MNGWILITLTAVLAMATGVLAWVEHRRWRPEIVCTLETVHMGQGISTDRHSVWKIVNIGGSAAHAVEFEFERFKTMFVRHPDGAAEMSAELRLPVLAPNSPVYVYLSKDMPHHEQREEQRKASGSGWSARYSETERFVVEGTVSYRRLLRCRKERIELRQPKWWTGEMFDMSEQAIKEVVALQTDAQDHNVVRSVLSQMRENDADEDAEE